MSRASDSPWYYVSLAVVSALLVAIVLSAGPLAGVLAFLAVMVTAFFWGTA